MMGEINAAYAKGLDDAAEIIQELEGDDYLFRRLATIHSLTTSILALSSIPPGSRVVVVPPDGSAEFEALVERMASAIFPEFYGGCSGGELVELGASLARDHARAALRALTGGEP